MALPGWARGMNEVEWVTSRRYLSYRTASYAVSVALCWSFWFLAYALPVQVFLSTSRGSRRRT